MSYILVAKDIIKQYDNHLALDRINISVPKGSIYGLSFWKKCHKTVSIEQKSSLSYFCIFT